MKNALNHINETLEVITRIPVKLYLKVMVGIASVLLIFSFFFPLWKIHMVAPQYPEGLSLYIYTHKIEGGNNGNDIQEINTLNHYIGMETLDSSKIIDLSWIPFAIGGFIILGLRFMVIGTFSTALDLLILKLYFSLFVFFRFVLKLYSAGHNLDPAAPMQVDPFMPVIIGSKQIANFKTYSYPAMGSLFLAIFVLVLVFTLVQSYRQSKK